MPNLLGLELCQVDSQTSAVFQNLCSHPRYLHISTVQVSTLPDASAILESIHGALAAVSSIEALSALDLDLSGINCWPFYFPPEPRDDRIPMPSIRFLSVLEQHIYSFRIERPSRRPLRRLSTTELRTPGETSQPAHLLHLRKYPRDLQTYLQSIREASPVGLSLHSFIDMPQYWAQLPADPNWADEDAQALAELPTRLPHVMPTLHYIAWAAKRAPPEYEWYEEEYDCAPAEYTWYLVAEGPRLVTMSACEGERVRRFLLGADFDRISKHMDGTEHL
ncbi:hypothetical protein LXA43DRAFT_1177488 [Ganoderma leucocontextum]|nr:hypothetical protein LXA43DRAFT_1177488 [Ganoderma leucocontextum]